MVDLEKYITDAIRTESHIDRVQSNPTLLLPALKAFIAAGNILDMVKKNVFYGKPISEEDYAKELSTLRIQSMMELQESPSYGDLDADQVKRDFNINPRVFHALIGIMTESAELGESLLSGLSAETGEVDSVNILEELGDLNWYQAIAIDALDGSFENVLNANIAKLRARYPEKFTQDAAINRDLTNERQVLEDNTTNS